MPVDECLRPGLDGEVRLPAGIEVTELGIAVLDQYPKPPIAGALFGKREATTVRPSGRADRSSCT